MTMSDLEREINSVVDTANATAQPVTTTTVAYLCCQVCMRGRPYNPADPMPTECGTEYKRQHAALAAAGQLTAIKGGAAA